MEVQYTNYKILSNRKEVADLIQACKVTKYCSLDFETTGTDFYNEEAFPTILGISFQPGSGFIIPLGHHESPFKDNWVEILRWFSDEVFMDMSILKVIFNAKFEHKWLFRYNCGFRGRVFDVMLMKYLLDEERPNDLKSLVRRLLIQYSNYEQEMDGLVKKYGWAKVPIDPLSKYCALDCDLTLRLCIILEPKLIKNKFYNLFRNLLMMCSRFYAEAEYNGMLINREFLVILEKLSKQDIETSENSLLKHKTVVRFDKYAKQMHMDKLIDKVQVEIEELVTKYKSESDPKKIKSLQKQISNREEKISRYLMGELASSKEKYGGVNFGSPKQLIALFYEHPKGFNYPIVVRTDTGNPSTGEEALTAIRTELIQSGKMKGLEFIDTLLKLRGDSKLYGTYIKGMLERLTPSNRVHGRFLIHGTVTGRTSSQDPNLQNIPRSTTSSHIKTYFIPPPGYLVLEVDYSQAELRVVAEAANETTMISWFAKGYNIHVATACHANGGIEQYLEVKDVILKDENHPDNLLWEKRKKNAKLVNFGILYGQTKWKLSEALGCTPDEAQEFLDRWFSDFPKIRDYIKKQQKMAVTHGYVTSLWGRKRRLPDAQIPATDYTNKGFRAKALRDAVNAPIQSASNDYTLFANVVIREEKLKGNLPWDLQFLASVHDALVFYIQPKDIHRCVPIIQAICANPSTMEWFGFEMKKVVMKTSAEVGKTWGTKKDYSKDIDYTPYLKDIDYPHHPEYTQNYFNINKLKFDSTCEDIDFENLNN